jgi:hypothetical protein
MEINALIGQRIIQAHNIGNDVVTLKVESGAVYQLPATPWAASLEFDEVTTLVAEVEGSLHELWGQRVENISVERQGKDMQILSLKTMKGLCVLSLFRDSPSNEGDWDPIMKVDTGPAPEGVGHYIVRNGAIVETDAPEIHSGRFYGPENLCLKCGRSKGGGDVCPACNQCLSEKDDIYHLSRISPKSERLITHNGKVLWVPCRFGAQPYSTPIPEGMVVVNYSTWPREAFSIVTWNYMNGEKGRIEQAVQELQLRDGPLHQSDEGMSFFLERAIEETFLQRRIDKEEPRPVSRSAGAEVYAVHIDLLYNHVEKVISRIVQENLGNSLFLLETPNKKILILPKSFYFWGEHDLQ